MAEPVILQLPWPPSVNHYWKPGVRLPSIEKLLKAPEDARTLYHWLLRHSHGYIYLTREGKRWRERCIKEVNKQAWNVRLEGRLQCRVDLYPPGHEADFDNYNKPLFDAVEHSGLYENDRQIRACLIVMNDIKPNGMVRLKLENIGA